MHFENKEPTGNLEYFMEACKHVENLIVNRLVAEKTLKMYFDSLPFTFHFSFEQVS